MRTAGAVFWVIIGVIAGLLHYTNHPYHVQFPSTLKNCSIYRASAPVSFMRLDASSGRVFVVGSDVLAWHLNGAPRLPSSFWVTDLSALKPTLMRIPVVKYFEANYLIGAHDIFTTEDGKTYFFVIRHGNPTQQSDFRGEYVDIFEFRENHLWFIETIANENFHQLGGISATGPSSFYLTNNNIWPKNQTVFEMFTGPKSNVIHFDVSTNTATTVVSGGFYSINGIATNQDRSKVYLVDGIAKRVRVFNRDSVSNSLSELQNETIVTNSFVQNVVVDADDNLWVTVHPQPLKLLRHIYAQNASVLYTTGMNATVASPSQIFKYEWNTVNNSWIQHNIYSTEGHDFPAIGSAVGFGKFTLLSSFSKAELKMCPSP